MSEGEEGDVVRAFVTFCQEEYPRRLLEIVEAMRLVAPYPARPFLDLLCQFYRDWTAQLESRGEFDGPPSTDLVTGLRSGLGAGGEVVTPPATSEGTTLQPEKVDE